MRSDPALTYTECMRVLFALLFCAAACRAQGPLSTFPAIEQWRTAVIGGNAAALKSLYSTIPPAVISTTSGKSDADAAIAFWTGLHARAVQLRVLEAGTLRPGLQAFTLEAKVKRASGRTTTVVEGQTWEDQGSIWRIVGEKRDIAKLEQPTTVSDHIYPTGDARQEIQSALTQARQQHKNILLVFGADWCYDCHVLEKAFHRPDVAAVLNANYVIADIDVGEGDKNLDLAAAYQIPLNRGVPAIAVLDANGTLIYSQKNGEWERARALAPRDLLVFLDKWRPRRG
jgi:thioredoxin 1